MEVVYVTNRGTSEHTDSYLGVSYSFRCGETIEIPVKVAQELLGYGHVRKEPYIVRLGWAVTNNDMPKALERLASIEISDQPPVKNRVLPSSVDSVTPFPVTGRGRKVSKAA